MITAELEGKIHAAMEASGGKARAAADLLGLEPSKLYAILHNNKNLKARWASSKDGVQPPSEAVTLHRPAMLVEQEIATAIEKEDAAVRKGLDAIGITGKARELAVALQKFQHSHYTKAVEMLGGGITKQFFELMAEVDRITERINSGQLAPDHEIALREDRARLLDIMGRFYDRANQATLVQAKIRALQNQTDTKGPKAGKPGFTPLVAVQGTHVTINEK